MRKKNAKCTTVLLVMYNLKYILFAGKKNGDCIYKRGRSLCVCVCVCVCFIFFVVNNW